MVSFDFSCELGTMEMKAIYNGWISDKKKMESLARSDSRHPNKIVKDAVTGMIGEWGAYHFLKSYGFECKKPQCGVLNRDNTIWGKDLEVLQSISVKTASGKIVTVGNSVSCKAQLLSQTKWLWDDEPSWTFQLNTSDRHGDPMLNDLSANKLLVVSWVDDYWDVTGEPVYHRNPKVPYKAGFRFCPQVTCFWWPDVSSFLRLPKRMDLWEKKTCLYFKDIKQLQAHVTK